MKINPIICVFVHLLNLISREKFKPEPGFAMGFEGTGGPSSNPGSGSNVSLEIKFTYNI